MPDMARYPCVPLIRDVASVTWRCATCDAVPANRIISRMREIPSVPDHVLEHFEPTRLAWLRKNLCRYILRKFFDACGINREQIWHKIRPWLPGVTLVVMLAVVLRAN